MKVVLVNGSPNANGCAYTGLSIIKEQLAVHGVDSEIYQVGNKPIVGCTGCRTCRQPGKSGRASGCHDKLYPLTLFPFLPGRSDTKL